MAFHYYLVACLIALRSAFAALLPARSTRSLRPRPLVADTAVTPCKLLQEYPYYHTTRQIHDELVDLGARCPGMTLDTRTRSGDDGHNRTIDVVTIRSYVERPVNRNLALFGEHARELISPESGLHLVRALCGLTDLAAHATEVLQDNEFRLIINANPGSREEVERGNYCLRTNPSGVDLNRNWDEEWEGAGPRPFSEAETLIVKEVAVEYQPTNFLTVHSGTRGLYMPWAYNRDRLATRNRLQMLSILRSLATSYCECPFGGAGREVGYRCPGTSLDWVYDKLQTPYSFAFEIYVSDEMDEDLRSRWREKMSSGASELQVGSNLAHPFFKDLFQNHPSNFVQLSSSEELESMDSAWCISFFNPQTEAVYNKTVHNWVKAYLELAALVARELRREHASRV